ncbi:polysaccharide deacetylase family protein [Paractinoplanes lichenicola]|uniref:Polysaccharide deacetylase family protein n=1 Tax=Paractinoplanes lichenicola TaxID=2802976 RepID=A0ABS1W2R3_9ACTN|nr:polysaccharide deacetylase family protein [Actinoplanes lichenicola]MBL7261036.1 polysaccharide deacetylase family protein [Actinoplanes lichenicola]
MTLSRAYRALAIAGLFSVMAACGDHATPVPESSPSVSPSAAPSIESAPVVADPRAALPANLRPRVPRFAPPPPATKVTLPANGTAGWFSRIPTDQKVAFITIDDGWEKNPLAVKLFQAADVPIALFLEVNAISDNPGYFQQLQATGATIQNHTISHPVLKGRSYAFQKHEICGGADQLGRLYGKRPTLFRPPGGAHDATTLRAAHDCGMKAAFFWKETTHKGKVRFQEGTAVQPGDIILMHFRPRFVDDFLAVLNAIHKAGLTPARLEDYIP